MIGRAAALAGLLLTSCSFERKSSPFECAQPSECMPGRTCVQGFCVLGDPNDGGLDADPADGAPPPDGPAGDAPAGDASPPDAPEPDAPPPDADIDAS
jgi:hypothetical protein